MRTLHDLYFEKRFDRLFDFDLVGIGPNLEQAPGWRSRSRAMPFSEINGAWIISCGPFMPPTSLPVVLSAGSVRIKCS